MAITEQELVEKIRAAFANVPQLEASVRSFLSVKEEDYARIKSFLSQPDLPSTIETYGFFNKQLAYLPKNSRPGVWVGIVTIWDLATQYGVGPEDTILALGRLFGLDQNLGPVVGLINDLEHVRQRYSILGKRLAYAARNARILTGVMTASDLRAVYKEDFSVAMDEMEYDPILDLEALTPVANVRLTFNNKEFDFIDFACDINGLETLIHILRMTQKQLQALNEVAGALGREQRQNER